MLKDRVVNRVFKSYSSSSVEYHAGGFFVRKNAVYLVFLSSMDVYYFEREEGLHPKDNDYSFLLSNLDKIEKEKFEIIENSSNVLILKSEKEIRLVPSIFMESVEQEKLSEILIDWGENKTLIFNLVYTMSGNFRLTL
ncbi:hypothetical protein FEZ18_03450 [Oceanihabitans sp. IOP_32]|uniref:hypothetical protein n=1 Tax=Oceanihabitans sp. IOP_32 TaxID=2529032 RepID=UPI001292D154|nr:hypothetical protein [Oceanihabitans sp. IOP_32]QFZ53924.1 hypothetical protein FEZ18_03405 [Oceanihabitans sp. IOP_32]QFZ53931.1 hypothetical protein FEZ18_03450 [Oceanihabitans sp. IOP_32]